jgi:hypothetical protein
VLRVRMMGWSCGRRKDTIEGRDEEERRVV